jgi:ADP-heptose:LPS heptosyltransferase
MEVKPVAEEENVIRKILVKCPPKMEDSFNVFPFLIALSEEFPKAEINLICEEKCSDAFLFFPFKVRAFERPKDKLSLIQTHHYCANMHDIFNIDLFFDLENSFNSSFMGFNFRAKERVGYGVGWNKYFLTKNFMPDETATLERKCVKLLELYMDRPLRNIRVARSLDNEVQPVEKIAPLFQEPEPPKFIMVMLDNFQNVTKQIEHWKKFFDSFQNQKFVIWSQGDEDMISELFLSIDLGHNDLFMHRGKNTKEMIYLLEKVQGVVTNNLWAEGLCNYFCVNQASFIFDPTLVLPGYQYYSYKPQRFLINESGIKFSYLDEERTMEEMNQVIDHLHFRFKL